jgi:hypothetical protein
LFSPSISNPHPHPNANLIHTNDGSRSFGILFWNSKRFQCSRTGCQQRRKGISLPKCVLFLPESFEGSSWTGTKGGGAEEIGVTMIGSAEGGGVEKDIWK